uniref:EGF-like domain-containing protein n=1 Tax=Timema genevievae TaxID=629358 RepID=A0A7R9JZH7_TIMGE|nr:unnamed protein product [Timema genevievae]
MRVLSRVIAAAVGVYKRLRGVAGVGTATLQYDSPLPLHPQGGLGTATLQYDSPLPPQGGLGTATLQYDFPPKPLNKGCIVLRPKSHPLTELRPEEEEDIILYPPKLRPKDVTDEVYCHQSGVLRSEDPTNSVTRTKTSAGDGENEVWIPAGCTELRTRAGVFRGKNDRLTIYCAVSNQRSLRQTDICGVGGGSPCEHDGNCVNTPGSFACNCTQGFTGPRCETNVNECESHPCQNDGSCLDDPGTFRCVCMPGQSL